MSYSGGFINFPLRAIIAVLRRLGAQLACLKARLECRHVGARVHIAPGVYFQQPGIVSLDDNCRIYQRVRVADIPGQLLDLGPGVQVNADVHLDTTGGLVIGARSLISERVKVFTHDHGYDPRSAPYPIAKLIGSDVWIGMQAVILPGCRKIGDFAIIGAGAVVARDVPAGAIMVGNPARRIGTNPRMEDT